MNEREFILPKGPKTKSRTCSATKDTSGSNVRPAFPSYEEFADLKVKTRMLANLEAEQSALLEDLWKEHTKNKRSLWITNCIILVISSVALTIGLWNLLLC